MNPATELLNKVLADVKAGSYQSPTCPKFEELFYRFISEHPLEEWEWLFLLQYAGEFVMNREKQGADPKP